MESKLIQEGKFGYWESGEGQPVLVLHGLMGDLSNFDGVFNYFPKQGYRVIIPQLPVYTLPIIKTNIKNLAKFVKEFLDLKKIESVVLLGNSLGGHVSLLFAKMHLDCVKALVLTGSSGLYEKSMGNTYPRRGDKEYVRKKVEEVFYDPNIVTEDLMNSVMDSINDRNKVVRTLALAKSAIRHNMAKDLGGMNVPACVIWGKGDIVTPPEVAEDFEKLLPDADLYWIEKCGHAAMMEHPDEFNTILHNWFKSRGL